MSDSQSDPDSKERPVSAESSSPDETDAPDEAPAHDEADTSEADEADVPAHNEADAPEDADALADVPDWDDEYIDRVSDRLLYNYNLEKDRRFRGERFTLYGQLEVHSEKHFFHPSLSFGHHDAHEHLFARRTEDVTVEDAERVVELGHELADEWITANEEHYSTDFTFVLVAPTIPESVREFVAGFSDRTLLKYGYYGHYEINLVAVAPEEEDIVASSEATVEEAFRLWVPIEKEEPSLLRLIARRFQI